MANSVDPDETPRFVDSHPGLHCLLRRMSEYIGKYGNIDIEIVASVLFGSGTSLKGNNLLSLCSIFLRAGHGFEGYDETLAKRVPV